MNVLILLAVAGVVVPAYLFCRSIVLAIRDANGDAAQRARINRTFTAIRNGSAR